MYISKKQTRQIARKMADNVSNTIAGILTQARDEIRANMQTQNINASGRTSAALQVRQNGSRIELVKVTGENAPFQTLQYGRGAGRVPRGFFYIIQQWTRDKGFSFKNEKHRNAFTAYVVNKVKTEGTNRHETPNTQVYSEPIKKAVEAVGQEVRRYILQSVQATIKVNFR